MCLYILKYMFNVSCLMSLAFLSCSLISCSLLSIQLSQIAHHVIWVSSTYLITFISLLSFLSQEFSSCLNVVLIISCWLNLFLLRMFKCHFFVIVASVYYFCVCLSIFLRSVASVCMLKNHVHFLLSFFLCRDFLSSSCSWKVEARSNYCEEREKMSNFLSVWTSVKKSLFLISSIIS